MHCNTFGHNTSIFLVVEFNVICLTPSGINLQLFQEYIALGDIHVPKSGVPNFINNTITVF